MEAAVTRSRWRLASVTCDRCLLQPLDTKLHKTETMCNITMCSVWKCGQFTLTKVSYWLMSLVAWRTFKINGTFRFDKMFFIVYYLQIIKIFITLRKIRQYEKQYGSHPANRKHSHNFSLKFKVIFMEHFYNFISIWYIVRTLRKHSQTTFSSFSWERSSSPNNKQHFWNLLMTLYL